MSKFDAYDARMKPPSVPLGQLDPRGLKIYTNSQFLQVSQIHKDSVWKHSYRVSCKRPRDNKVMSVEPQVYCLYRVLTECFLGVRFTAETSVPGRL